MSRNAVAEPGITDPSTSTDVRPRTAPRWKVILHNDDVTTFEFVIELLVTLFRKPRAEAVELADEVHARQAAVIVVTSLERGELYVDQVHSLARPRGYPLTASLEAE